MEFKDKIKSLRIASGMTMAELAKKINVSTPTIQRYESGEIQNVRRDKIKLLAVREYVENVIDNYLKNI